MPDHNQYTIIGRLTADPELRRIPSGAAVAELRLVTNKKWKDKQGNDKEETLYIDAVAWEKLAEICCQYLHKGSHVFVQGPLKLEQWQDKTSGENRSKIKLQAETVTFLDSKPKDGNGGGGGYQERGRAEAPAASRSAPPAGRGGAPAARTAPTVPMTQREVDDDIPF